MMRFLAGALIGLLLTQALPTETLFAGLGERATALRKWVGAGADSTTAWTGAEPPASAEAPLAPDPTPAAQGAPATTAAAPAAHSTLPGEPPLASPEQRLAELRRKIDRLLQEHHP